MTLELTDEQTNRRSFVAAVLANDDTSTDEELAEYFLECGLDASVIPMILSQRQKYLNPPLGQMPPEYFTVPELG